MGECILLKSSGANDLDRITATASDILQGKVGVNPEGDAISGTISKRASAETSDMYVGTDGKLYLIKLPEGYYMKTTAHVNHPEAWIELETVRSKIGFTSDVLQHGKPMLGITGTFTSDGNISAGDIVKDKVAYSKGAKIVGTMPIWNGYTITPGTSNIRAIAKDACCKNADIVVRGDTNFIASNIKKGVTIWGVTGTFEGYVATIGYIFNKGAWGSGSSLSSWTAIRFKETGGSYASTTSLSVNTQYFDINKHWGTAYGGGAYLNGAINLSAYRYVDIDLSFEGTPTQGVTIYLTRSSAISVANEITASVLTSSNTKVAGTVRLNVESINEAAFLNIVVPKQSNTSSSSGLKVRVTRIQLIAK